MLDLLDSKLADGLLFEKNADGSVVRPDVLAQLKSLKDGAATVNALG